MKPVKSDMYNLITYSNLYKEALTVSKNYKNKRRLNLYYNSFNSNVYDILYRLRSNNYVFSMPHIFLIKEHKYRIIMSQNINDKIVSHFVTNQFLKPVLEKKLIMQNVATRKNLGGKAAIDFFMKYLKSFDLSKKVYALKIDLSKYFYSIPHGKLLTMLRRDVKDEVALSIIKSVLDQTDNPYVNKRIESLVQTEIWRVKNMGLDPVNEASIISELRKVPRYKKGCGVQIGDNMAQFIGVYYLNKIDRFIKEELKAKCYLRYVDDLVILSSDYEYLKKSFELITKEINDLDLSINPKSNIFIVNSGFTFLGRTYKIKNSKIESKVKNKTYKAALKSLKKKRKLDFYEYYKSKVSYYSIIPKFLLISLEEEYKFLKESNDCLVIMDDNKKFYDKTHKSFILYLEKRKKRESLITFLKREKIPYVYLTNTVCVKF